MTLDDLRFAIGRHRWRFAGVSALILTSVLAEAAGLALFSVLLDLWVGAQGALRHTGWIGAVQSFVRAHPQEFFAVLGLTYVGKGFLSLWSAYASISLALELADEWRLRLLEGLLAAPTRALPPKQGELLQLVIDEPAVAGAGLSAAGILVQNAASAATVYATLLWISPPITLALTGIGAVAALALLVLTRYTHRIAEQRSRAYTDGYGYLTEMLGALRQLRIFGLERAVETRTASHLSGMRSANLRGTVVASSPRTIIELVFFSAAIIALAVASPRVGDPAALSGVALAVVAAMRLLPAFSAAAGTWVQVQQAMPAVRRIRVELTRLEGALVETRRTDAGRAATFARRIECRDLRFWYPDRPEVLRGVNLDIEAGTFVALVGQSGSGKTTLLDLLCGLHDPHGGGILVDGDDLRTISRASWRGLLGVVPQDAFLLSGTLRENLCLLRPDCPDALLDRALAAVGADALVADLPQGLDTIVGERGVSLSGGQRQRLALARVLIREPRLLVLDEATSALDPESDEMVFRRLQHYKPGLTVIAVAHRLSSVRAADCIYVMQDGVVAESGTHDRLLQRGGAYAAMWRAAERDTLPPLIVGDHVQASHGRA